MGVYERDRENVDPLERLVNIREIARGLIRHLERLRAVRASFRSRFSNFVREEKDSVLFALGLDITSLITSLATFNVFV